MTCHGYGEASPAGARFCPACGVRLSAPDDGAGAHPTKLSGTSGDLEGALKAIARTAARLCVAKDAQIMLVEGDRLRVVAHHGPIPLGRSADDPYPVDRGTLSGCAILERRAIHVRDSRVAIARGRFEHLRSVMRPGVRTMLSMPFVHDGRAIGAILIRRTVVRPFSARQIELLRTFAEQAAITIENARLSRELQARNHDLGDALAHQTATAEILQVISRSPTDLQPVLDAIVQTAARLCGAYGASIYRREGDTLRLTAHHGPILGPVGLLVPVVRGTVGGRCVLDQQPVHVEDLQAEVEEFPEGSAFARQRGHRTTLGVPLLREGVAVGSLQIRRNVVSLFAPRQVALLQVFADQVVIAIENVRLFTELGARNRDLTEALEQQTATAEILRVISSSPTDLQPLLDRMAESAARFCLAHDATIARLEGDRLVNVAHHGPLSGSLGYVIPVVRGTVARCRQRDLRRRPRPSERRRGENPPEGNVHARVVAQ